MSQLNIKVLQADGKILQDVNVPHFPFRIGRTVENDLEIKDNKMSRQHLLIENRNDSYFIVDQKSTNGSFDDQGNKISEIEIKTSTQKIRVGDTWLQFSIKELALASNEPIDPEKTNFSPLPAQNIFASANITFATLEKDHLDKVILRLSNTRQLFIASAIVVILSLIMQEQSLFSLSVKSGVFYVVFLLIAIPGSLLSWGLAKLFKGHEKFSVFYATSFFTLCVLVLLNMIGEYLKFLSPETPILFSLIDITIVAVFIYNFLMGLRLTFNARFWIFKTFRALSLFGFILGVIGVFMENKTAWKSPDDFADFEPLPFRAPASATKTSEQFVKEFSESLSTLRSQK